MKTIAGLQLVLWLSSCATSSLQTEAVKETASPYIRLLTLYIEKPLDFHRFDATFYTGVLMGDFNDLRTMTVRSQMEKTLERNLSRSGTQVIPSSKLFNLNTKVDYELFQSKVDSAGADAILLINEDQYWETRSYERFGSSSWKTDSQPNSAFHFYLVDAPSGEILWLGRCTINGINAGYDVLNNMLARKITRELKARKYIL